MDLLSFERGGAQRHQTLKKANLKRFARLNHDSVLGAQGLERHSTFRRTPYLASRAPTRKRYNRGSSPQTRKRPRDTEPKQNTNRRPAKRSRKLVQQPSPAHQPRDQKRPQEVIDKNSMEAPRKRARPSLENTIVEAPADQEAAGIVRGGEIDPVGYWTKAHHWPEGYAEQRNDTMSHLFAKQKSAASLRRKRSELASIESVSDAPSSTTPSDQKPREAKSVPYQDPRYETLLATKGSFMGKPTLGITEKSQSAYLDLLSTEQTIPKDSLFADELFEETCEMIRDKNETRVIRDISQLIVPSAEILAIRGANTLKILIESVNEGWNNSMPLTGTRPQPDYSVGFKREAFTKDQLDKLSPFIGDFITGDQSYFMATYYMYFPFLTCEVKCGAAALRIAERQNAHSMTLAVRAIVELFRLVGREMELHREILAFSISHNDTSVGIYGHYPVIDGKDTMYYCHPIHKFDFTVLRGKEKWTAYKFTKGIYNTWMPAHFERLCSAIDKIPADLDFGVPPFSLNSGLSQDLGSHHLSEPTEPESLSPEPSHRSIDAAGSNTPDTSFTGQGASKRRRKKHTAG